MHLLTDRDFEAKTAICATCGPVKIRTRMRGNQRVAECFVKYQADHQARILSGRKTASKYGISHEAFLRLRDEAGGKCRICRRAKRLVVDHDHSCCPGKKACGECVRGMICTACNNGLGMFDDDPARLRAALEYLASS